VNARTIGQSSQPAMNMCAACAHCTWPNSFLTEHWHMIILAQKMLMKSNKNNRKWGNENGK